MLHWRLQGLPVLLLGIACRGRAGACLDPTQVWAGYAIGPVAAAATAATAAAAAVAHTLEAESLESCGGRQAAVVRFVLRRSIERIGYP